MTEQATQKVSQWVATPAVRDPIWLPPDVRRAAHLVAVIRALLLDSRLTAGDDYHEIVSTLTPLVQTYKNAAEPVALEIAHNWEATTRPKVPLAAFRQVAGFTGRWLFGGPAPRLPEFESPDAQVTTFSQRWLFGSKAGYLALWALATVDASGVDPLGLDWGRTQSSETWQAAYGKQTTRPSRRQHKAMMARLKRQGWHTLKDPELLATAGAWVECYHIFRSLSAWLVALGSGYEALGNASKRFEPLEKALGVRKKPGRPMRVSSV